MPYIDGASLDRVLKAWGTSSNGRTETETLFSLVQSTSNETAERSTSAFVSTNGGSRSRRDRAERKTVATAQTPALDPPKSDSYFRSAATVVAPAYLGLDSALRIDGFVMGFALAASLLTAVAFGLLPALRSSGTDPSHALRGAAGGRGRRGGRILSGLVVAEISLALLLLVGGSLMVRSFVHLLDVPLGLRPEGVLTFRVGLSGEGYESADRRRAFHAALLERLGRLPGVTGAAGVSPLPMSSEYSGSGFTIVGRPEPADWHAMSAQYLSATPHYFKTMGIPVRLGREFEEGDGTSRQVVIVNEALVRKHFPGENPVGHVLGHGAGIVIGTIVGVAGDIHHGGPTIPPDPQIYGPEPGRPSATLSFVVRTTGDPMALASLVRQQVQALDPALPADRIKPMTAMMGETIADLRLITGLLSGFALFALALAAIGIYGVTSYSTRQRRYEIGVRLALGASPRRVLATVVARAAMLAAIGMAIGLPLALAATRLMATMLFGVGPRDAGVFTLAPVVLLAAALAASYLPARDAAATDPIEALRQE
jgi:predicted permease